MRTARCKSEACGAVIVWCRTENGRKMPMDAAPIDQSVVHRRADGVRISAQFVLRDEGSPEGPLALSVPADAFPGEPHYLSHFDTCVAAQDHRRVRR